MYKVYLIKTKDNLIKTYPKIKTPNPFKARDEFMKLVRTPELKGKKAAAILSLDNRKIISHRFDSRPGCSDYVENDEEIELI